MDDVCCCEYVIEHASGPGVVQRLADPITYNKVHAVLYAVCCCVLGLLEVGVGVPPHNLKLLL